MKINDTKKHLKMTRLYGFMYEPKANLSLGLEILTDMWLVKNGTYQAIICIYKLLYKSMHYHCTTETLARLPPTKSETLTSYKTVTFDMDTG